MRPKARHPRGGPRGGRDRAPRSAAARPDRQPLRGAGRSGVRLQRRCSRRFTTVDGIERIRFASPHPRHVSPRFLEAMARLPKICRHLHLPVQSGSTRVLEAMRRRYTRDSYLDLVAQIRETLPDVALSTDMIVGFPGETDADFDDTLSLTAAVGYHSMFSFKYSPRPNTLADKRLPDDVRGRGEDAADRGAAGAAAGDSDGAERAAGRADGRRAGRRGEPAARDRAVGPDEQERRRQPAGAGGVDWADGAGPGRAGRPAQRLGPDDGRRHRCAEGCRAPCKSR